MQRDVHNKRMVSVSLPASIIIIIVVFLSFKTVSAQSVLGARSVSLGQASTALPNAEWALFSNPAMISPKRGSISFFGIRYYGFSEITDMAAAGSYPTKWGVLGLGVHRYGFDLFNENRVRLAYKNAIQRFNYGVVLNYNHVVQGAGYGSDGAIGVDAGIAAMLFEGAWIAARATNINQPEYGKIEEPLPRELAIGISYQLSEIALFTSDVVKDVRFPLSYRGGIEVYIFQGFAGRIGVTTSPVTFSGGFGYSTKIWRINVAAQNHVELGISPGLDLTIRF